MVPGMVGIPGTGEVVGYTGVVVVYWGWSK